MKNTGLVCFGKPIFPLFLCLFLIVKIKFKSISKRILFYLMVLFIFIVFSLPFLYLYLHTIINNIFHGSNSESIGYVEWIRFLMEIYF